MTLRQLESFLAVARAGSFRRAAERVALSQPALSQHIREMERELGAPVFDRLGRSIALTPAGRVLEEHAGRIFATLRGVREAVAELAGIERGSLVLGGSTTPGIYVLPRLLGHFKARHPQIDVTLRIGNTREIEERVGAAEVDLGIVGGHLGRVRQTCIEASLVDRVILIVAPTHPWARLRSIASPQLREATLLVREEGSATRRVTEVALGRRGIVPRARLELGHTEAIKQGVAAGLGVAFVSEHAVRDEVETRRLRAIAVRGLAIQRHFHVIRHAARSLTPAAGALLALLSSDRALHRLAAGRSSGAPPRRARRSSAEMGAVSRGSLPPRDRGSR